MPIAGLKNNKAAPELVINSPSGVSVQSSRNSEQTIGVLNRTTMSDAKTINPTMSVGSVILPHLSNQTSPYHGFDNERITEESEEFDKEDKEFFDKYFKKRNRNLDQSVEDFKMETTEFYRNVNEMS